MTGNSRSATRGGLLRWAGWFGMANAALYGLVGLRYLGYYALPADTLGLVYTVLATVGHFASLGLLTVLPVLLLVVILPRRLPATCVAVPLAATVLTLLVLDSSVFAEHRYHLTPLTFVILERSTWVMAGVIGVIALVFEALLANTLAGWTATRRRRGGVALGIGLVAVWLAGQALHIWADALGNVSVTGLTRYLPAYFPIHAKRTLARLGWVDAVTVEHQRLLQRTARTGGGPLEYPLRPMTCNTGDKPLNVLMVVIDGLRPDVIEPALLPNITALARTGQSFANHFSGGNSSRAGLFSVFYGLPSTYMEAFYGVQRAPVLMEQFRTRGYAFGLFAAPGFGTPTDLDRTAFAGFSGLPGERHDISGVERNREVTIQWLNWLRERDPARPFFGFLYYDPPMGEMSPEPDGTLPLGDRFDGDEIGTRWRQYLRAMGLMDAEIGRLRTALADQGLEDRTLLVLFSDHGYEFDDFGAGYVGHASSFSWAQLRSTLILDWPGRPARTWTHRTAHQDLVPTLLTHVFGCDGPVVDYSTGQDLFSGRGWDSFIAGSYNAHAIVQPDRVVVTEPGGFAEVRGPDSRPLSGARLDRALIEAALADMRRFYR